MAITTMITRRGQVSLFSTITNSETTLYPIVNRYLILLTLDHDNSYVFSNMQIAQQPEKFFDQNQFLLADSAYTVL
ncbi:hypothetical protein VP01_2098g1 [Puccinia sorghi]|uniref:DDE Tnp4 domain-containing protein n=1 Tax=Puccinia sorghi TaxID=27349 RepID=A0A0L6VA71_9BASI|nr:hypothetical protein VP01_2098g1 [Puccinia sorghi]